MTPSALKSLTSSPIAHSYLGRYLLLAEFLLRVAQCTDFTQQLVRFYEQPGAEEEGEQIGAVRVVVRGWYHVLNQGVQRPRDEIPAVPINQGLEQREAPCIKLMTNEARGKGNMFGNAK